MTNRENVIAEVLKRTTGKEVYTKEELTIVTEKLDEILPRYGDRPMSISENVVEKEVLAYIKEKESSNVGLRNLFPPVKICCGEALNFRLSSKCIVFEKNSGGVSGLIYTGSCKKCKTIYSTNSLKKGTAESYYNDVLEQRYFMSTRDTVFENHLIFAVDRNM